MSDRDEIQLPLRPSLPVLMWLVGALWVGLAVGQRAQWVAYASGAALSAVWWLGSAAGAVGVLIGLWRRWSWITLVLLGFWVGTVLGLTYWGHWRTDVAAISDARTATWPVEVLGDETVSQFGASSVCRFVSGKTSGALVNVQWPAGVRVPPLGSRVEVAGATKPPAADERGLRASRAGSVGTLRARSIRDVRWASSMRGLVGRVRFWAVEEMSSIPGEGGALLSGVVVGDRRRLAGTQADTDFRTTGLTHLVAVSGSHLVVVAAVVGWLIAALGVGRVWRSVGVAVVVGGYVIFSGVQPSAVRAWVMAVAAASAWTSGRRTDGGSSLAVAAAGVLATAPSSAFDLGFQLSVAAVAGLVLFARLAETWLVAAVGRRARWIASPVALTLTATVATVPITVSTFAMLSLVSPAANVVAGPLVSLALVLGLIGLAAARVWEGAGRIVLSVASLPATAAVNVAHTMAGVPYAAIVLGVAALPAAVACALAGSAVWVAWPAPTRRAARGAVAVLIVGAALLAVGPPVAPGATIEVLDVGQGDAILVRDGGSAVLVDTGPNAGAMRAALARAGVRRLDAIVITHLHADHFGGLGAMAGVVNVSSVLLPAGAAASDSVAVATARTLVGTECVREVVSGDRLRVGELTLDVIWPRAPVPDAATNEASVVLRVREGRFTAVLTGDAEGEVLQPLVTDGVLGDLDVLKVGHHGSLGAVTPEELVVLRPEYSLISVGAGNRFGHPKQPMLAELARAGSRVLRTDRCGDITVRVRPDGRYTIRLSNKSVMRVSSVLSVVHRRSRSATPCATLDPTEKPSATSAGPTTESHGETALRVQARLPHLRRPRPPPRAGLGAAQAQCGGARGPRLQLRDL